jgi:phospholipid/cholesterol/gamma-HCH transport system substrate-binding protein
MRRRLPMVGAAVVAVVAAAAAAVLVAVRPAAASRTVVAHFARAVGIHEGSDVRVLGVRIGSVVTVTPEGRTVRVEMRYESTYDIPADARAVIVPPSVVSDRYVQLAPAYTGGARLPDHADLPPARTVAPLEIDDVYRALDEFNRAMGPNGVNAAGALSDLVATGRANLAGNGEHLRSTLDGLAQALSTLADGRQDLFGSIANLQRFTTMLAESDQQVRLFNAQLADVAEQLAGERQELAAALRSLGVALAEITEFVRQNRAELKANVAALADITGVLVRQQRAIIDVLDLAPLALSNLNLAYNPRSATLDTRDNALGPYEPASYVCSLLVDAVAPDSGRLTAGSAPLRPLAADGPVQQVPRECVALAQTLAAARLPLTDQLRRLLGLPPGTAPPGRVPPDTSNAPGVPGVPGAPGMPGGNLPNDPTLGGILRGHP